jgi:hypothetical protein
MLKLLLNSLDCYKFVKMFTEYLRVQVKFNCCQNILLKQYITSYSMCYIFKRQYTNLLKLYLIWFVSTEILTAKDITSTTLLKTYISFNICYL